MACIALPVFRLVSSVITCKIGLLWIQESEKGRTSWRARGTRDCMGFLGRAPIGVLGKWCRCTALDRESILNWIRTLKELQSFSVYSKIVVGIAIMFDAVLPLFEVLEIGMAFCTRNTNSVKIGWWMAENCIGVLLAQNRWRRRISLFIAVPPMLFEVLYWPVNLHPHQILLNSVKKLLSYGLLFKLL